MSIATSNHFANQLLHWYQTYGRKNLPWQENRQPYNIWVSEIMLQQTQVITVIDYYQRFIARFPNVNSLATATSDEVMHLWAGLGYYTRARNLHRCAQQVVNEYQGEFPVNSLEAMKNLPGIGPSTAAAICAFSTGQRAVILDGNVKRVVARYFAIEGWYGKSQVTKQLWQAADKLTPNEQLPEYTQAIMDLGATLCTRSKPKCELCPVASGCAAKAQNLIAILPTPRPKKVLPEQTRYALILFDANQAIQLEKRPDKGIWGGLWSLPEFASQAALKNWLATHQPTAKMLDATKPAQEHIFSHYRLTLHLNIAQLPKQQLAENSAHYSQGLNWYDQNEFGSIGLAAPVKKLLPSLPYLLS
ncbi:MAG TPA: A/G-specific adenine glycosylase [Marinospirillum sp.]|uniref:A/G-specific adenine glycosylase n=1 Tax=Marinospirillum sp. TaxID=2183934 RepID=UPI002B460D5C|nr:A/G-specific adenine glycosylase [Marinospirillum sp.]HKM15208.1 A/G-specific adenine glycosylase [Marinospirillum sp.]